MQIFVVPEVDGAVRQCEILSGVIQHCFDLDKLKSDQFEVLRPTHPFAVVLTQDCDLVQDYAARFGTPQKKGSQIPGVLLCEAIEAEILRGRQGMHSKLWDPIKKNKNERYQFLESAPPGGDCQGEQLPELAIDFKRYFTVPTGELYWQIEAGQCTRRTWLSSPYREHLANRFAHFLARIALPRDYQSV